MTSVEKSNRNLEQEETLQAVVVADDFEEVFSDYTHSLSSVLIPIANICAIDYTLEFLGRNGVQETILFCSSHARVIKEHLKFSSWTQPSSSMTVTVMVSEKCQSLGDALRDIDNKGIIKTDFILLSAFTVSNMNLVKILNFHRQVRSKDKGAVMTMVVQNAGSRNPLLDYSTYVVNAVSKRLLMQKKCSKLSKFEIPLEYLISNVNINIYSSIADTGVTICSPSVPLLFSDNFDFQTKEDFIRGLLLNEEILDSRIYCYQAENSYGLTVKNWHTYQKVTMDCIRRWTFPLVPDQFFTNQKKFSFYRDCIYKQPGVQLVNAKLEMDVMVGAKSQIEHNSVLLRSVIGKNCKIGRNVFIRDSFIFDNVVIGNNNKIELCVIGDNSRIKENVKLKNCFLKKDVRVNGKACFDGAIIMSTQIDKNWKKINDQAYLVYKNENQPKLKENSSEDVGFGLIDPEVVYTEVYEEEDEDEFSSMSDNEKSDLLSPEPDDNMLFYTEVVDSLHRGFEEKLSCDNLILEINSSRYAYNVVLSDVTVLTLKGILLLPSRVKSTTKTVLSYFLPLLKNYVKSSKAQLNCLELIEEISEELGNEVAKCLHYLYDNDIISEDSILNWHKTLDNDSPVSIKVAPLIKWLNEAAEESSSEEAD